MMDAKQKYKMDYEHVTKQLKPQKPHQRFSTQDEEKMFQIVLFTDTMQGYTDGMVLYFDLFDDVRTYVVHNMDEWNKEIEKKNCTPDFLLFVGLLKDETGYQAVKRAACLNTDTVTVMYDNISSFGTEKAEKFYIVNYFEIYLPLELLTGFLRAKYEDVRFLNHLGQEGQALLSRMNSRQTWILDKLNDCRKAFKIKKDGQ